MRPERVAEPGPAPAARRHRRTLHHHRMSAVSHVPASGFAVAPKSLGSSRLREASRAPDPANAPSDGRLEIDVGGFVRDSPRSRDFDPANCDASAMVVDVVDLVGERLRTAWHFGRQALVLAVSPVVCISSPPPDPAPDEVLRTLRLRRLGLGRSRRRRGARGLRDLRLRLGVVGAPGQQDGDREGQRECAAYVHEVPSREQRQHAETTHLGDRGTRPKAKPVENGRWWRQMA